MYRKTAHYFLAFWFLFVATLNGAELHWVGNAQDRAQRDTMAVTGTWATGDTWTLVINKKSLTGTVGSAVSTANVADMIARAVDAANATADLLGNETRNLGGQQIPEFNEIDADANGSTVTFTSATAGVPYTITRSEVTAGDGALGAITSVVVATGKNWLNNADNYDTGNLPIDNDTLHIDIGSVSILYALDYFRANNIDLTMNVSTNYGGQIGRPLLNPNGYVDYRANRYFQYRGGGKQFTINPGNSPIAQQRKWFNFEDQVGVTISLLANAGDVTLSGADATDPHGTVTILKGVVTIEPDDAPVASTKTFFGDGIAIGYDGGGVADPKVTIGRNTRLHLCDSLQINSGTILIQAATKGVGGETPSTINSGVVEFAARNGQLPHGGDHGNITVRAGATVYPSGSEQSTGTIYNYGTVDYGRNPSQSAPDAIKMYAGSTLKIANNTLAILNIDFPGTSPSQTTIDFPPNRRIDFSADAVP